MPTEVTSAAGSQGGLLYTMTAYGGEANFAFPPRPDDPKTPWNIQWETKVRYKTTTGGMLGRNMPGAGGFSGADSNGASSSGEASSSAVSNTTKRKGSLFGDMVKQGLTSMLPGGN